MTPEDETRLYTEALQAVYDGATTLEGAALRDWLDDRGMRLHRVDCMDDDCRCFAAGERTARAGMAERQTDVVEACTRLVETISGDGP